MRIDSALLLGLIDLVVSGVKMLPAARRRYDKVRSRVQKFVDEGRDPTPAEWMELIEQSREISERIRKS